MHKTLLRISSLLTLLFLTSVTSPLLAENTKDFGPYVIHYNAFRSDTLEPEVAKAYNLMRRNNRVILNIAILKKVMNTTGTPTNAKVTGHASNLTGQLKKLEFREINEGTAIYYLAETKFSDGEFLKFNLRINIEGEEHAARLKFDKRFFTN